VSSGSGPATGHWHCTALAHGLHWQQVGIEGTHAFSGAASVQSRPLYSGTGEGGFGLVCFKFEREPEHVSDPAWGPLSGMRPWHVATSIHPTGTATVTGSLRPWGLGGESGDGTAPINLSPLVVSTFGFRKQFHSPTPRGEGPLWPGAAARPVSRTFLW
jgi:hypothetical protein